MEELHILPKTCVSFPYLRCVSCIRGLMSTCLHGTMTAWLYVYMAPWLVGFMSTWHRDHLESCLVDIMITWHHCWCLSSSMLSSLASLLATLHCLPFWYCGTLIYECFNVIVCFLIFNIHILIGIFICVGSLMRRLFAFCYSFLYSLLSPFWEWMIIVTDIVFFFVLIYFGNDYEVMAILKWEKFIASLVQEHLGSWIKPYLRGGLDLDQKAL